MHRRRRGRSRFGRDGGCRRSRGVAAAAGRARVVARAFVARWDSSVRAAAHDRVGQRQRGGGDDGRRRRCCLSRFCWRRWPRSSPVLDSELSRRRLAQANQREQTRRQQQATARRRRHHRRSGNRRDRHGGSTRVGCTRTRAAGDHCGRQNSKRKQLESQAQANNDLRAREEASRWESGSNPCVKYIMHHSVPRPFVPVASSLGDPRRRLCCADRATPCGTVGKSDQTVGVAACGNGRRPGRLFVVHLRLDERPPTSPCS